MQSFFSKAVFIASAVLFVSGIFPDRVKLKNGKIHDNVKTSLRGNTLSIQYENGKQEMIPASEIAELKPAKIQWKQTAAKKSAEPEVTAKKEPAQTETETLPEKGSYNYLYSLIPGWSSLNTGRFWYLGIGISLLEFGELRRISGKNETRPLLDNDDARNMQILSVLNGRADGSGNFLRDTLLIGFYRNHTLNGRNAEDDMESFINRRNGFIALSLLTVFDVVLTRTLQDKAAWKPDSASFNFTFRTAGKENFFIAFTKNF